MDFIKINLFINTVRFLKTSQIFYRILKKFKKKYSYEPLKRKLNISGIYWISVLRPPEIYNQKNNSFNFLHISKNFKKKIDWNFSMYGKLWTYNLNYFDFLNQDSINVNIGIQLIDQFIKFSPYHKDAIEVYPISLRTINWIKFLSENNVADNCVNEFLFRDCNFLYNNLEYHILGNHLLENAFSLLFASYYFQNDKFYQKANFLIKKQLEVQVLNDGGHFELSPMYHKIILTRTLDSINLINLNPDFKKDSLLNFLTVKAKLMCSWLESITYESGNVPMVNDSAYDIAFRSKEIINYARLIGVSKVEKVLSDSGYRMIKFSNYELFIDVGNIGPDYQPGHAHSDTFNFELQYKKSPIIVDTGISTYEKNKTRQLQRSTYSHNTVILSDFEQSEIWGGFRVARRAKVFDLNETNNKISAKHNGYRNKGVIHCRSFQWLKNKIIIKDSLKISSEGKAKAIFHLHSDIIKPEIQSDKVVLTNKGIIFQFYGYTSINIIYYDLCEGFNKTVKASKILVSFDKELETHINL